MMMMMLMVMTMIVRKTKNRKCVVGYNMQKKRTEENDGSEVAMCVYEAVDEWSSMDINYGFDKGEEEGREKETS